MYEVGCLRFIPRAWEQFYGPNFANLAEHHVRVMWLSLLIAKMEGAGNREKILKMALAHDITESRTGDVHYISRQYTQRDEHKAAEDIFTDTSLEKEFTALWKEFEDKACLEAKIVKDADWLDVDLEIAEQKVKGVKFVEIWEEGRKHMPDILFTQSAKTLWHDIKKSDPTDWIKSARNRFTEGDYKNIIDSKNHG